MSWVALATLVLGCGEPQSQSPMPEPISLAPYEPPATPESLPEVDQAFDFFRQEYVDYIPGDVYRGAHEMGYTDGLILVWQRGAEVFPYECVGSTIGMTGKGSHEFFLGLEDGFRLCVDDCARVAQSGADSARLKQMVAERFREMTGEDVATQQSRLSVALTGTQ